MMSEDKSVSNEHKTEARRDFIKKAAYIAPVVMTMNAMPSLAQAGSVAAPAGKTCPTGYELDSTGTCVKARE